MGRLTWWWLLLIVSLPAAGRAPIHRGTERWVIKTTGDFSQVPVRTTVADLLQTNAKGVAHNDPRFQTQRIPQPFGTANQFIEGRLYEVQAYLHLVAEEPDGDYHAQLSSSAQGQAHCLVVEVPRPAYAPSLPLNETRAYLDSLYKGKVPQTGRRLKKPQLVCARGIFFMDDAHLKANGTVEPRGKAGCRSPTVAELHPVVITPGACVSPPTTK